MNVVWCVAALLSAQWAGVRAHGRLVEPPSRASAWRYGFDTPHNYNDHELYCGGFTRQWQRNGGKCGVCGDAWDAPAPRAHELGGRFGRGVIVRRYTPGALVTIKVELTASHMGFFEFRLCEEPKATTQECLDRNVLKLEGSNSTKYFPKDGNKVYEMKYRLPEGLECTHCVLQWKYIAGNNWGTCADGSGAVGCGPQEEFRACADVAVDANAPTTRRPRPARPSSDVPASPTSPTAPTAPAASAWYGPGIALATLFVALVALAGIYLYYYRGGMRIKSLLKSQAAAAGAAPVPPPRHKRPSLCKDSTPPADAGFHTVDLRPQ
ncbi:uncharacterized protein [Battus philenor]|uniref:uncharacterized protein n=1 Tax=Battus philenor TaxID=42288 RepID=UPI0035CF73E3